MAYFCYHCGVCLMVLGHTYGVKIFTLNMIFATHKRGHLSELWRSHHCYSSRMCDSTALKVDALRGRFGSRSVSSYPHLSPDFVFYLWILWVRCAHAIFPKYAWYTVFGPIFLSVRTVQKTIIHIIIW